jgi:uncharacterized membrane protein
MDWHVLIGGQRYGPFPDDELRRLVRAGRLRPQDMVWNATMGNEWAPAWSIPGLFETPPPAIADARPAGTGGMTPNAELMAWARASLKGNWGTAVGVAFVYGLILGVSSNLCGFIPLIIAGPLELGLAIFFLCIARRSGARFGQLFDGFSDFGAALATYLLMMIFVFLWSLLLIIPGIIAAYAYSMTFYILADDPNVGPLEAIRKSKQMMLGKKGKLFCLHLRFIGWWLLCILSCGIGFLWLTPYVYAATVHFYDDLAPAAASGTRQEPPVQWETQGGTALP